MNRFCQIILPVLFSLSFNAYSQENKKQFDTCEDNQSIVRELNSNKWLVCHYDGTYSNFSRVTASAIASYSMKIPDFFTENK